VISYLKSSVHGSLNLLHYSVQCACMFFATVMLIINTKCCAIIVGLLGIGFNLNGPKIIDEFHSLWALYLGIIFWSK